jgi:amino acid adenylation domain-containing protein
VGTPIANRTQAETEGVVGFFVNTLALRLVFSDDESFRALLGRIRAACLGAYEHQEMPFERLVQELAPERDLGRSPLFQVMFVLQSAPREPAAPSGARSAGGLDVELGTAKFDLTLSMMESPRGLAGSIEYATDLFDAPTIDRMAAHLRVLLEGIAADPEQKPWELPLLPEDERRQLLVGWNATATPYPNEGCLHQRFEAQASLSPDATAVVFDAERLTYRELDARANQLANHLGKLGVGPDVLVGVVMERSLELMVAIFGIHKAGGAYVPLDPAYPAERLAFLLADTRAAVVLTQARFRSLLAEAPAAIVALDDEPALALESVERPVCLADPGHASYVIYTSGSTGRPKGVVIPHAAIANRVLWLCATWPLRPDDAVLHKTPITFDASVWEFFAPLLGGARVVMARPEGHRDAGYLIQALVDHDVTVLQLVPSMAEILALEPGLERCTSLRRLYCGGETLHRALVERFRARLPGLEVINTYGPTEAAIDSTYWACDDGRSSPMMPIGRPIANATIYLVDEHLSPVPIGVAGELTIGGLGLARGYLNRPELTSEKFIPDPFGDRLGARLYRTGDRARYLPDGTI